MNMLLIYFGIVALLSLLSLIVILNFVRYRYKGDHTIFFLVIFVVIFLADIIFTVNLLNTTALNSQPDTFDNFQP